MKIAIIGAGPAGIFASILLKSFPGEIHIFEQNKDIGEKLKTTGGGRMNITNKIFTEQQFSSSSQNLLKKIFKNPHFKKREEIFKKLETKYHWENNRAILESTNAVSEVLRLKNILQNQPNLTLHLNTKITNIIPNNNQLKLKFTPLNEGGRGEPSITFDKVIITTGGMLRLNNLCTKEKIYTLPFQLNHTITPIQPSLCPLLFSDEKLSQLSGTSFTGTLTDKSNNKSIQGDVLITHGGLSGPAVLDFSAIKESDNLELSFTKKTTEKEFIQEFNAMRNGKNAIRKFLKNYIPQRLIDFHLTESEINQNFMADVPKKNLQTLAKSIFSYQLPHLHRNTYPTSWTTKGGIPLTEINNATFESKNQPNVFFAGEILDFNGLCGGYNISFAAISAQIVADAIIK